MTLRTILVPLDGSSFGAHALPHAISLAKGAGAALVLARVLVPQDLFGSADIYMPVPEEEKRLAAEQAQKYLEETASRIRAVSSVSVTTAFLHGSVAEELCSLVSKSAIDLVALTTHGRGRFSRFWLGSVATDLIHLCTTPLLVVRPSEADADLAADLAPRRILLPLDGSKSGEGMITLATAIGSASGAQYRLLRSVSPLRFGGWGGADAPPIEALPAVDQLQKDAQAYLDGVRTRFPALKAAESRVAVEASPAAAILAAAEDGPCDLIAMETQDRRGLSRLILGSVADKVLRETHTPLLLRRTPGA